MSMPLATEILSFENFGALENHLRTIRNKYNDMIKKYEETLGFILRDTKPTSAKSQKIQEKWALEMQHAMTATSATKSTQIAKKEENKPKILFGANKNKDKEKDKPEGSGEWIPIDPMSLFIGQKNRGLAEIYFDTITVLREYVNKINSAISICSALRAKAATAGSTSLVVSFINNIPTKMVFKSLRGEGLKKYNMAFSFAVPSMPQAAKSLAVK